MTCYNDLPTKSDRNKGRPPWLRSIELDVGELVPEDDLRAPKWVPASSRTTRSSGAATQGDSCVILGCDDNKEPVANLVIWYVHEHVHPERVLMVPPARRGKLCARVSMTSGVRDEGLQHGD